MRCSVATGPPALTFPSSGSDSLSAAVLSSSDRLAAMTFSPAGSSGLSAMTRSPAGGSCGLATMTFSPAMTHSPAGVAGGLSALLSASDSELGDVAFPQLPTDSLDLDIASQLYARLLQHDNGPQLDDNEQPDDSPRIDDNEQMDDSPHLDDNDQLDDSPQLNDSEQRDGSPQLEDSKQLDGSQQPDYYEQPENRCGTLGHTEQPSNSMQFESQQPQETSSQLQDSGPLENYTHLQRTGQHSGLIGAETVSRHTFMNTQPKITKLVDHNGNSEHNNRQLEIQTEMKNETQTAASGQLSSLGKLGINRQLEMTPTDTRRIANIQLNDSRQQMSCGPVSHGPTSPFPNPSVLPLFRRPETPHVAQSRGGPREARGVSNGITADCGPHPSDRIEERPWLGTQRRKKSCEFVNHRRRVDYERQEITKRPKKSHTENRQLHDWRLPQHDITQDSQLPQHSRTPDSRHLQHSRTTDSRIPQHGRTLDCRLPAHSRTLDSRLPEYSRTLDSPLPDHGRTLDSRHLQCVRTVDSQLPQHGRSLDSRHQEHGRSLDSGLSEHSRTLDSSLPDHSRTLDSRHPEQCRTHIRQHPEHNRLFSKSNGLIDHSPGPEKNRQLNDWKTPGQKRRRVGDYRLQGNTRQQLENKIENQRLLNDSIFPEYNQSVNGRLSDSRKVVSNGSLFGSGFLECARQHDELENSRRRTNAPLSATPRQIEDYPVQENSRQLNDCGRREKPGRLNTDGSPQALPKCLVCNADIQERDLVRAAGAGKMHMRCLTCHLCPDRDLDVSQHSTIFVQGGKIVCSQHFVKPSTTNDSSSPTPGTSNSATNHSSSPTPGTSTTNDASSPTPGTSNSATNHSSSPTPGTSTTYHSSSPTPGTSHSTYLSSKECCAGCHHQMQANEWVYRVGKAAYHISCFCCSECHIQFVVNTEFYLKDQRLLCEKHITEDDEEIKEDETETRVKRSRTQFTAEQMEVLMRCFERNSKPDPTELQEIAQPLNLSKRKVQVWFQNHRARHRNLQKNQEPST